MKLFRRRLNKQQITIVIRRLAMVAIIFALGVVVGKESFSSKAGPATVTASPYVMPATAPIAVSDPQRSTYESPNKTDF